MDVAAAMAARYDNAGAKGKKPAAKDKKKEAMEPPPHVPKEAVTEAMMGTAPLAKLMAVT